MSIGLIGAAGITPWYSISFNGNSVSSLVRPRLIQADVTDGTGMESDAISIVLDNADDAIAMPMRGGIISFSGGYKETGILPFGTFKIEEIEKQGPKKTITITGRSASIGESLKQRKNMAYEDETVSGIISKIAGENGLSPAVAGSVAGKQIPYRAQLGESDANLLTWLGERFNAVATVKEGKLIFAPKGESLTVSGGAMPVVSVGPNDLYGEDAWSWRGSGRPIHGQVKAYWHDLKEGVRKEVQTSGKGGRASSGGSAGNYIAELTQLFQNEQEAQDAVEGKAGQLAREEEDLNMTLIGRPEIRAECKQIVSGIDKDADGVWVVDQAVHTFAGSDIYTVSTTAKRK